MEPQTLRQLAIDFFNGIESTNEILKKFIDYIGAYCADLKCSESDILYNDKLFNNVYGLFEIVILKKQYQLNEV
jgi:hypothetical protein